MSDDERIPNQMSCTKARNEQLRLLTALGKAIFSVRKVIVIDSLGLVERLDAIHRMLWEVATIRITHSEFDPEGGLNELRLLDECPLNTDV